MNKEFPEYCAVIRTLGRAGWTYQRLLDSLVSQTVPPQRIIVYLAEGYERPAETVGTEHIVYVPKGMVAQRALPYTEVDTEWMLMLDDDIDIAPDGVERMFDAIIDHKADVCAMDGFPHHLIPTSRKLAMAILASSVPVPFRKKKGYTVNCAGKDCYNPSPKANTAWSTTNSGNGILCRKSDFLNIHFEDDLWLDEAPYAIPEDKVMFYKMHLAGLRILTHYNSGFVHLDAGTSIQGVDRASKIAYSSARNNNIFYELYVRPNLPAWKRPLSAALRAYQSVVGGLYNLLFDRKNTPHRRRGLRDAKIYLKKNGK